MSVDNEITGLLSGRKRLLSIVFDGDEVDQSEKLHSVHDIVEEKLLGVVLVSHLAHYPSLELKNLKYGLLNLIREPVPQPLKIDEAFAYNEDWK